MKRGLLLYLACACLSLSALSTESQARAGRCNIVMRPSSVQSALEGVAEKTTKRCTDRHGASITNEQRTACRTQGQNAERNFRSNVIDRDRRQYINPEARDPRELRGAPRPRAFEQPMRRCGGGNGVGRRERSTLREMRQAVQRGDINNGVLGCFCRNDTQKQRVAQELQALVVPPRQALPLPTELLTPARALEKPMVLPTPSIPIEGGSDFFFGAP